MSVHGEFDRYLKASVEALRGSGEPSHAARADALEREASDPKLPLEERARRVLDGPLGEDPGQWQGFPRVEPPLDSLIAVSRVILGR